MGYRIGIDVGGTFTDFVVIRPSGETLLHKVATTPGDESLGVLAGLHALAAREKLATRALLSKTVLVVHGTTTADNTLITMSGAVTGLLTTAGHRDQIEIRRGYKEEIWDPAYPPPIPIAPRRRRLGIPERLDFRGEVIVPLDEDATRRAIHRLAKQGVESIAVCLLFSYVNPVHEKRVRELVAEEHPGARVSLSHEVMPTAPEFERTSTTLVDAYVGPRVSGYLERLRRVLAEEGYPHELLLMQSNGGVMPADFVASRPVATLGSGPAGGVVAAARTAERASIDALIAVDMGGTSYEVCLITGARPKVRSGWSWVQRYLVGLPMVDIHSIGAGGGSIARVEAGVLRVGPESAGAMPGPICYGRGGTLPTVTDANVVLGYLDPRALCGGALPLDADAARSAIAEHIAAPLGLPIEQAAAGIARIVNANMANAIRRVSCQAGHDPRDFAMVVYGGNGPVHAGKQAEELGIGKLLVPRTSPAFSALGLLLAEHVVAGQRAYIAPARRARAEEIDARLDELAAVATAAFARAGIAKSALRFERSLQMSYPGQTFDISVPATAAADGRMTQADLERAAASFHDLYEQLHSYASRNEEPLVRAVRLEVFAPAPTPRNGEEASATGSPRDALVTERRAYFDGRFVATPVYAGERLGAGHRLEGPAIVEERFTTLVLYPGHKAELDGLGNYVVTL